MSPTITTDKQLVLRDTTEATLSLLAANTDAEAVLVQLDDDGKVPQEECLALFQALAYFPRLVNLRVTFLRFPLPVTALTAILSQPTSRIANLELIGITLSGKIQEYLALVESIRQQSSLESIELAHCSFVEAKISLDPLLRALSTVPTLQHVSLTGTKVSPSESPSWDCQYLQQLILQLTSLKIGSMQDIKYEQIAVIMEALEDPSCSIKELVITDQELESESLESIADMLRINISIEDFIIELHDPAEVVTIAEALQHRKSNIKRLSLVGDWAEDAKLDFYSKARRALLDMVQTNVKIENLYLGESDATIDLSNEMATYVKLNVDSQRGLFSNDKMHALCCCH